jgi:hypothetical protein
MQVVNRMRSLAKVVMLAVLAAAMISSFILIGGMSTAGPVHASPGNPATLTFCIGNGTMALGNCQTPTTTVLKTVSVTSVVTSGVTISTTNTTRFTVTSSTEVTETATVTVTITPN